MDKRQWIVDNYIKAAATYNAMMDLRFNKPITDADIQTATDICVGFQEATAEAGMRPLLLSRVIKKTGSPKNEFWDRPETDIEFHTVEHLVAKYGPHPAFSPSTYPLNHGRMTRYYTLDDDHYVHVQFYVRETIHSYGYNGFGANLGICTKADMKKVSEGNVVPEKGQNAPTLDKILAIARESLALAKSPS